MGNTQANDKQPKSGKSPQAKSKNFIRNYRKSPGRESKKHGKKKGDQKREAIDREIDKTPDSDNVEVIETSDNDTVECSHEGEGSASAQSEVTVSRCGRSATCAPAPPAASPADPSSSDSVFTDPLTPLAAAGAAVELNQCYYSAESDSALEDAPAPTLTPSPAADRSGCVDMPHDDAASALSTDDTEKEEKTDVFDDSNDREENEKVMGGTISGVRSESAKQSNECNHDFLDNRLKATPGQTSFTVSKHRRVELPPVEPSLTLLETTTSESDRRHSSVSDVLMTESNVLRKVASLTLDKHSETRVVRPKYVPDKLDFRLYEKFEGQMLLNWFVSSVSENSHLKSLVNPQDLKNLCIQLYTHLLAAGVLRQISDKDAPTENIFKPSLMYYWAHMEAPASQPVTPGRLTTASWPPDKDPQYPTTDTCYSLDNNKFFSQNNNEEASDITEARTVISQQRKKIQELEYQLEKYKINTKIEALNKSLEKDYNELTILRNKTQLTSKDLPTNSGSEINKLENKPVINIPEYDPVRTNVNIDKKLELSSLDSKNEMLIKEITSTPEVRSDKIENYCKLNKSREYNNKDFKKSLPKGTIEDESELSAKIEDTVNDNVSSDTNIRCDSSSDASFRSIICTSTDLMCEVENLSYASNDNSAFRNTVSTPRFPNTQILYTNNEYKDPVAYDGHDIKSLQYDSLIFTKSEVKKQGVEKALPEVSLCSVTATAPVTEGPVSDKSPVDNISPDSNAASQAVVTPPPPSPGMPPLPPPMPGTDEYATTERALPEFKVPLPPQASSQPLRDEKSLTQSQLGPPSRLMPLMGPPPPPMPGMGPPPPPMPGMGSSMGPPPPPMPGMGPPPPPMPGMGPPPPPMPGMGPPPPPMPGMGPLPPPMPGMGPSMLGMTPPPPPMPGMTPALSAGGPPPPPGLPGSGIPPPPPSTYSGPVPFPAPPAGGWNVQRATLRKTPVKPAAPMKPLYWTRILAAPTPPVCQGESDSSGVKPLWLEIEETKLDNIDEFTDLFSRQVIKAPVKKKVEVKTKIQPVKILDSKRSQNVGILAQSLHVEFSEIENAIYNFDTSVVSLEALQQIYELRANEEELSMIKEHLNKKPELPMDKPEVFLHDLSGIPNFAERISCFMFQADFEDSVSTTMHKLDNLKHTCEFILTSESLKKVFAIILTLGNYMNGGNGQRGQADGFGLEILSKLKDVKSKQSNVTLLHFIVRTYMRSCGGALSETCALPVPEPGDVVRASALDFTDVATHLATLTNQLAACKEKTRKVLENDEARSPSDDAVHDGKKRLVVFKDKMSTFLQAAEEKLKTENENLEECRAKFIATVRFYQYTPKGSKLEDCEPKEFFSLWTPFCSDFKDIYKKEEQLAVKERLKEAKKLQEERKSQSQTQPKKEGGLKARLQRLSRK